jgi:heme oxygenase
MARMMPDPDSCLSRLRAGTRDAHARIETVPMLARLLSADLTEREYISILQHLHAFHTHLEPVVAAELAAMPAAAAMQDGSRPRALAADLAWFAAPAITPPPLPPLEGAAAALGALYVIEGSGLGGRVIARHLVDSLHVSSGAGGSFFCRLDADAARARWQRLSDVLDPPDADQPNADQPRLDKQAVVAGALGAFRCLDHWLRKVEIVPSTVRTAGTAEAVAP